MVSGITRKRARTQDYGDGVAQGDGYTSANRLTATGGLAL